MRPLLLPFVFAAALSAGGVQAANLLTNPGFELPSGTGYAALPGNSGAIAGWTTVLSGVEWFNATAYGGAADGIMVVDLANYVYTGGGIEQSFATVAGQTYDLSFSLGTMQASGRDGTAHIDVTLAGITTGYDVINHTGSTAWSSFSQSFVATGAATTLRFSNTENPYLHFAYVDSASVAAVPEPESWSMMLTGLLLVGFGLGRKRSAPRFLPLRPGKH
jgi:hypothetical protein